MLRALIVLLASAPALAGLSFDPPTSSWSWSALGGAVQPRYDLVRGNLDALLAAGTFDVGCLAGSLDAPSAIDPDTPAPGDAAYYLARGRELYQSGSYDSAGSGQLAPRAIYADGDCRPFSVSVDGVPPSSGQLGFELVEIRDNVLLFALTANEVDDLFGIAAQVGYTFTRLSYQSFDGEGTVLVDPSLSVSEPQPGRLDVVAVQAESDPYSGGVDVAGSGVTIRLAIAVTAPGFTTLELSNASVTLCDDFTQSCEPVPVTGPGLSILAGSN